MTIKHIPQKRQLCFNCHRGIHSEHNKDVKLFGLTIPALYDGKRCDCPICNYCLCDWCKEQRAIYGIKELEK